MQRSLGAIVGMVTVAAIAGCSSASSGGDAGQPAPTVTTTVTETAGTAGTSSPAAATNLTVTNAVRQQLVAAFAAGTGIKPSDYTGLVKGETYYAIDNTTGAHWAAGAVLPSMNSMRAQVSTQDDGGYAIFKQAASGGSWKSTDVGAVLPGAKCPISVPATVLAVWGWKPASCRPPTAG